MIYSKSSIKFWFLEGKLSDGNTMLIKIDRFPFLIGREKKCHLALSSKAVSRRHSEIYLSGDTPAVRDLGSTNGTFVNNKRINDGLILRDEDAVTFADQQFRIFSTDDKTRTTEHGRRTNHFSGPIKNKSFCDFYKLSKREQEVLFQLLQGKSTKAVANKLFISEGTAKNHVLNIFEKTNVHSRFALLALYNKFPGPKKK